MICGKTIFKTRVEAIEATSGMRKDDRSWRRTPLAKEIYFCNSCDGWHFTAKATKKKKPVFYKKEVSTEKVQNKNKVLIIHHRMKIK